MRRCWNWAILVAVCLVVSGALFVGLGLSPRTATTSSLEHDRAEAATRDAQASSRQAPANHQRVVGFAKQAEETDLRQNRAEAILLKESKEVERRESQPRQDGTILRERIIRSKLGKAERALHVTEHVVPDKEEDGLPAEARAKQVSKESVSFRRMYVADEVLVRLKPGVRADAFAELNAGFGARIHKKLLAPNTYVVKLKAATLDAVTQAVADYQKAAALVAYAEPNYIVHAIETVPNDTRFNELYAMRNTGQTGGTPGADIQATLAWDITRGSSSVLVGVIDTGVDYNHPDLAANMWTNPGEIPGNGVDDDGNGFIDDVHGWDFAYDDNNPMDGHYHGTHCAGTIGGVGDNGQGVTGVCWTVKMVALKFLSDSGSGTTDDAIDAVYYATQIGCDLTSNSWGGGGFSQALKDAIDDADANGSLFVAAAGNSGSNNDASPHYPSSYESENIIAVAATDHNDALAGFSCYGLTSVDLGAPGVDTLSCMPGNQYGTLSGTSMATPHVSGVCALVKSLMPGASTATLKSQVLSNVEPIPALNGKTVTGGRLNAFLAVQALAGPYLAVTDRVLDDSAGDGDGLLNPGESIGVDLTVRNVGSEPTFGVQAVLTTADPYLTITPPATRVLGDMASGDTVQLQYTVTISSSCPTPHTFALTLNMTDNAAGAWSSEINAPIIRAPQISVSPTALSQTLEVDQSASQVVTVTNGTSAEETLTWNASVAPPGYAVSDSDMSGGPAYNWIEISGSGTRITGFGDDTNLGPYNIGFSFPFYEGSFPTFRVCSNGWLSFTSSASSYYNYGLPSSSAPENLVAFFWDDLNFNSGGAAYYQLIDAETLVVQFNNVPYYADSTKKVTCQVLLKADGSMIFQYKLVNIANSCTIGIQNGTADEGVQVAYNQAYVRAGLAVQLTPQTSWLTVEPASGSTPVGASTPLNATFDATGLTPGDYSTEILISSNDPQNPLVVVPVSLTVSRPDGGSVVGECGSVTVNQSDSNQWHTVILNNTYTNPVVVMGPLSFNGADPSTVRVKDVTPNSFAWQIDEYDYKDGAHTTETVGYLVVEAGVHTLEDGTVLQAGTQSVGDTATPLAFPQAFAAAPVVVSQAVTVNDGRAVVTRQQSLTAGGLEIFLQSQEASGKAHGAETVAWIAMDKGTGMLAGLPFEVLATNDSVKENWFGIGFTQPFAVPPVVVAAMQTCDGGDTAGLRYQNLTVSGVDVKVEEEQSQDSEVTHTTEIVGAICLPAGDIVVPSSVIGEAGSVTIDQSDSNQWHTVTLENTYTNPVVVIGPPSFNGGQPTTVRVRNVTANSFEWQMDEYEYLDGYHTTETVGYLVVEAGVHTLEGGIVLQAGTQSVGDTATPLTFPQAFAAAPVVVSQAVTVNDARAVVTRQRSLTAGGLEIFLQSQEASGKAHGAETVAWIAVDKGSGTLAGLPFEALATNDSVKESWFGIGFSQPFAAPPVVVGAMQTCDGGDTAGLRHQNLTASGVDVKVEEETSKDSEVAHTTEVVGLICLGAGNLVPASVPNKTSDTCSVPGDAPVVDCVPCVEDEEESGQLYLRAAVYLPLVLIGPGIGL